MIDLLISSMHFLSELQNGVITSTEYLTDEIAALFKLDSAECVTLLDEENGFTSGDLGRLNDLIIGVVGEEGIFSADPRVVPEARLLRRLSYSEAQELASMGAKVLHPPSIQPARRHGIPLFIKDSNRPDEAGTQITSRPEREEAQVSSACHDLGR